MGWRGNAGQYQTLWNRGTPPFSFSFSGPTQAGLYVKFLQPGQVVGISAFLPAQGAGFQAFGWFAEDGQAQIIDYFSFVGYRKNPTVAGWTSAFIHPIPKVLAGHTYVATVVWFAASSNQIPCMLDGAGSGSDITIGNFVLPADTGTVPNGGTQTTLQPFLPGSMGGFKPAIDVLFLQS
jgi:hypothetical protein